MFNIYFLVNLIISYNIDFQAMNLNLNKEIDWLQISKFNTHDAESLLKLNEIIKGRIVSPQIFKRIPKGYVAKLLKVCQNQINAFSENKLTIQKVITIKNEQKLNLIKKARQYESRLLVSKSQINQLHDQVKLKHQTMKKVAQKIKKIEKEKEKQKKNKQQKAQNKQIIKQKYYCPFCKTDDFINKQIFQFHMNKQHSNGSSEEKQLKKFILELKEKEIALMEMVMKKNEELNMGTRLLYENQLNIRTQNFQQNYSISKIQHLKKNIYEPQEEDQQLFSSSQYVWLKKQNYDSQHKFQNQANSKSYCQKSNRKYNNTETERQQIDSNNDIYSQEEYIKQTSNRGNFNSIDKRNKNYNNSQQQISLYKTNNYQKQSESISKDIYKPDLRNFKYNTEQGETSIYQINNNQLNKSIKQNAGFIYFSGPLIDDQSDSQIQDYFNLIVETNKIADEEIYINQNLLSKLEYSDVKLKNSTVKRGEESSAKRGEKSDQKILIQDMLLSYEDSIEDKDFSLSKDSNSINLSDLKFSKLEKKIEKSKEKPNAILLQQNYKSCESLVSNNQQQFPKIELEKQIETSHDQSYNFLKQFYKKQQKLEEFTEKKKQKISKTENPKKQTRKTQNGREQSKKIQMSNILNQFLYDGEPQLYPRKKNSKKESYIPPANNQIQYFQSNLSNIITSKKTENPNPIKTLTKTQKPAKNQQPIISQRIETSRLILKQLQELALIKQESELQNSMQNLDSHISFESVKTIHENTL